MPGPPLCPGRAGRLHARPGPGGDELVRGDSQLGDDAGNAI